MRKLTLLAVLVAVFVGPITAATGAAAQSGNSAPAGLVRIPFPKDDGSLTPYTFELGYPLVTLVYDTLLWRDADGVPQPWLARSVETRADGRQVTLRLADGARWHDGEPVTAADVVFTFRYVSQHPHPRFTAELSMVDSVRAADPATVVIGLRQASPGFMDQPLADVPILPAHIWQGLPKGRTAPDGPPVGSGPYRLVEHSPGERYRFEANQDYFKGAPAVSTIEVPIVKDAADAARALERGEVDVATSLPADVGSRRTGLGTRTVKGPSYVGTVLMFNVRRPPFDRPAVRQAVGRALDLAQLARVVGDAVPAVNGYLHPASAWAAAEPLQAFDQRAAREAFAGMSLPPVRVLVADHDAARLLAARQVALDLQRVGLAAEPKPVPSEELSKAVGEDGSAPSFDLAVWGAPPLASYDPDFLKRLFGSDPDATLNYSGYRSPAFDSIAERVATTADTTARRAAVGEALRLLSTDLPVVPLFYSNGSFSYRQAAYDGWVFVKGSGILDKRSFTGPRGQGDTAAPPSTVAAGPVGVTTAATSAGLSPLGVAALGLVVVAAVLAVVALVRRRG